MTVFSPPYSERTHCLDPPQLQRKAGLHNTYFFSSSWGNMPNWFQKGMNSERSCSNTCTGEEGGTITPGGLSCVSVFCFLERTRGGLSFWKRNHGKNYLKHSLQCHFFPPTFHPQHNLGTWSSFPANSSSSALLRLHYEGHHILSSSAPKPYCWIQATRRVAVLLGFFPKMLLIIYQTNWTNIYWPKICQAQG